MEMPSNRIISFLDPRNAELQNVIPRTSAIPCHPVCLWRLGVSATEKKNNYARFLCIKCAIAFRGIFPLRPLDRSGYRADGIIATGCGRDTSNFTDRRVAYIIVPLETRYRCRGEGRAARRYKTNESGESDGLAETRSPASRGEKDYRGFRGNGQRPVDGGLFPHSCESISFDSSRANIRDWVARIARPEDAFFHRGFKQFQVSGGRASPTGSYLSQRLLRHRYDTRDTLKVPHSNAEFCGDPRG